MRFGKILIIGLGFAMAGLAACQWGQDEKAELQETIARLEKKVIDSASARVDYKTVEVLTELLLEYVEEYPDDSLAPYYLLRAAQYYQLQGRADRTLALLDSLRQRYPASAQAPVALFFSAVVCDQDLDNDSCALQRLDLFIRQYPDHELADDARQLKALITLSEEELLKRIIARQDSAAS